MKKILLVLIILLLVGCSKTQEQLIYKEYLTYGEQLMDTNYYQYLNDSNPTVEFTLTDNSKIKFELFKDTAPNTVKSFLSLASTGYFDDTILHSKSEDFIFAEQKEKPLPDYTVVGEFISNGYENPLTISRGTLVLHHGGTNYDDGINMFTIQFTDELAEISDEFAVFGGIIEGFDGLTTLENLEDATNYDDAVTDFKITSVEIDAKGFDYSTFEKIEKSE